MPESTPIFEVPIKTPIVEFSPLAPAAFLTDAGVEGPAEADCATVRVTRALRRAAAEAAIEPKDLLIVSSAESGPAVRAFGAAALGDGMIPFSVGALLANPALRIVGFGYNEGGAALGWIVEAAKRNIDMTLILLNGGSCRRVRGGDPDPTVIRSALAADAGFAARVFPAGERDCSELIVRALRHRGFALLDCVCLCGVHDDPEQCRRFSKASYWLQDAGHDAGDGEGARRKSEEPFDTPPLGLFFEKSGRRTYGEAYPLIAEGGAPVALSVGLDQNGLSRLWDQFL